MPVYEFRCNTCGKVFEKFYDHVIQDGEIQTLSCPNCKAVNVTKLISRVNFCLKGEGWAKDGYSKEEK